MIRAFITTAITLAYVLILGTPMIIYSAITRDTNLLYRVGLLGIRIALWLAGVRMIVAGREKLANDQAVVFMSNHQGNIDPPALLVTLPPILIMVKRELFRIPVLGRGMRLRGFVPVDRKSRERAFAAVEEAIQKLEAGRSFLVFPEGTRSPDGRLQPFKKGVFVMAIKARTPIIPISISGSNKIMQKGRFAIHPGTVRITVHDPIATKSYDLEDRSQVIERVRDAILKGLEPDERPIGEPPTQSAAQSTIH